MSKKKRKRSNEESIGVNMDNKTNDIEINSEEELNDLLESENTPSEVIVDELTEKVVTEEEVVEVETVEEEPSEEEVQEDTIQETATKLTEELKNIPPVEVKVVASKEEDIIKNRLTEYVKDFRMSSVKTKEVLVEYSVKLANIIIDIHRSNKSEVFDVYLDFLVSSKDTLTNIVYAMDAVIKNGSRERNSVMVMHEAFIMIARSIIKKAKFDIKATVVRENVTNKTAINYIFSKL